MKVAAGRCGSWNSAQTLRGESQLMKILYGALFGALWTKQRPLFRNTGGKSVLTRYGESAPTRSMALSGHPLLPTGHRFSCANSIWRRQTSTRLGKPLRSSTPVAATKCRPRLGWISATCSRSRTSNPLSLNMNAWPPPTQRKKSRCLRYCLRGSA